MPDHISVEIAFVAYLKVKEAFALACQDEERAATASESARQFIHDHLANVAQPLAEHLDGSDITYLSKAGAASLCRVGQPPSAASPLPILHDEEQESGLVETWEAVARRFPEPLPLVQCWLWLSPSVAAEPCSNRPST